MSKYRIKYVYDTGDSFHNYPNQEGYVEITWENLDNAKANLKRIEEHYRLYKSLNSYNWRHENNEQDVLKEHSTKDWFVKKEIDVIFYKDVLRRDTYNAIDLTEERRILWESQGKTIGKVIDSSQAQNCIILYTDDNKPFQFWCPWCGYFEHLNFCEIEAVTPEENNMKFYA